MMQYIDVKTYWYLKYQLAMHKKLGREGKKGGSLLKQICLRSQKSIMLTN